MTKSSHPTFKNAQSGVDRRFTDFVSIHGKLVIKHLPEGIIIPALPENDSYIVPKNAVELRRAQLERYLNRLARNQTLICDTDLLMFLQLPERLPEVTNNRWRSLLSTSMITTEKDDWFDEKQVSIVILTFYKSHKIIKHSETHKNN